MAAAFESDDEHEDCNPVDAFVKLVFGQEAEVVSFVEAGPLWELNASAKPTAVKRSNCWMTMIDDVAHDHHMTTPRCFGL